MQVVALGVIPYGTHYFVFHIPFGEPQTSDLDSEGQLQLDTAEKTSLPSGCWQVSIIPIALVDTHYLLCSVGRLTHGNICKNAGLPRLTIDRRITYSLPVKNNTRSDWTVTLPATELAPSDETLSGSSQLQI